MTKKELLTTIGEYIDGAVREAVEAERARMAGALGFGQAPVNGSRVNGKPKRAYPANRKSPAKAEDDQALVLLALQELPGGSMQRQIVAKSGLNIGAVSRACKALRKQRKIRVETGHTETGHVCSRVYLRSEAS